MSEAINAVDLNAAAPAGYYIAIRVGYAFPMVEHNHLPAASVREYTVSGMIVHDPIMAWVYRNRGSAHVGAISEPTTLRASSNWPESWP